MGGNIILKKKVCKECNNEIGKFESEVCNELHFYRWYLGIKSKGRHVKTKAEVHLENGTINIMYHKGFEIKGFIPPLIRKENKSTFYTLIAKNPDKLKKQYKKQFARKFGETVVENNIKPVNVKVVFPGEILRFDSSNYLRLAAKIAFETFARKRYEQALSNEYDQIRNYIKNGNIENGRYPHVIYERELVETILRIPFPNHGILLIGYEGNIGSIVIIFGLFYYFVPLSENVSMLQNWDELTHFNVHNGNEHLQIYGPNPHFPSLIRRILNSINDPDVFRKANEHAKRKFNIELALQDKLKLIRYNIATQKKM